MQSEASRTPEIDLNTGDRAGRDDGRTPAVGRSVATAAMFKPERRITRRTFCQPRSEHFCSVADPVTKNRLLLRPSADPEQQSVGAVSRRLKVSQIREGSSELDD
jgi:hypothetical protein